MDVETNSRGMERDSSLSNPLLCVTHPHISGIERPLCFELDRTPCRRSPLVKRSLPYVLRCKMLLPAVRAPALLPNRTRAGPRAPSKIDDTRRNLPPDHESDGPSLGQHRRFRQTASCRRGRGNGRTAHRATQSIPAPKSVCVRSKRPGESSCQQHGCTQPYGSMTTSEHSGCSFSAPVRKWAAASHASAQ